MSQKISFIIGNGKSRASFDLKQLKNYGTIYGCNALYRDYTPDFVVPDFLVAIDPWMIEEIQKSDFPQYRFIIPPIELHWEPIEISPEQRRSNAGINAMLEAIRGGANELYCLGFDFLISDYQKSVDNCFANTANYTILPSEIDNIGRIRHLDYTLKNNRNVNFIFVFPNDTTIRLPSKNQNVDAISYSQLEQYIR
jgi:hypothetical protein